MHSQLTHLQIFQILAGVTGNTGQNRACEFYKKGQYFQCSNDSSQNVHDWPSLLWIQYKIMWIYDKVLVFLKASLCGFNFHSEIIPCFSIGREMKVLMRVTRLTDQKILDGHVWTCDSYQNQQLCSQVGLIPSACRGFLYLPTWLLSFLLMDMAPSLPPSIAKGQ